MVYLPTDPTHPSSNPAVHGRELNSRPVDHKSDAITTTLHYTSHQYHYHSGNVTDAAAAAAGDDDDDDDDVRR